MYPAQDRILLLSHTQEAVGEETLRKSLREDCIERGDTTLLRQWQTGKNGALTPDGVAAGSHKSVWWQCEKGHSYQMEVAYRVYRNSGCPYCAGRVNSSRGERYAAMLSRDQRGNTPEI